ncbi:ArnT family glycosyltransferase [Roseovarius nanhaiticus]|uniref:ArnT family glycosyltransferase n=1 Tax=Roseovarius nanhaiticus TaxID=573024 RepID=UPI00248FECDF|nr:glycosyltransferase family 39 protein [Roseovarius nanhaiticus]
MPLTHIRFLWATLGAFLLVRLTAMVTLPFTDTTESRYAEMARKMVETGNWLTPQDGYGVPFWGKPPLNTWMSAGGMELFGVNEFAARLPILLASLVILALVFAWVRGITGRNTALVSIAVLFSTVAFFGASAFVMTDIPMALGTTLVMVAFWKATCSEAPDRRWGYAVFLGLAIGMLAKGPVAVVLCVIPLALWLTIRRDWGLLRRLPWIKGGALLLALTVPWYAASEAATPGFLRYFLIGEHIERFLVPGWAGDLYGGGHDEAKGMIWIFWTGAIRPWSYVALIPLLWNIRGCTRAVRADGSGWMLYLLLWAISPMILFTFASNILPAYTIPGLPASAILMVVLYICLWGNAPGRWRRALFVGSASVSIAFFAGAAILAEAAPDMLRLKTHKALVAEAETLLPGAPLYRIGRRSFSSEYYTGGKVRLITMAQLAALDKKRPVALSVPDQYVSEINTLDYRRVGPFGRGNMLYVSGVTAK